MDLDKLFTSVDEKLTKKEAHKSNVPGRDEFGADLDWGRTGEMDRLLQGSDVEASVTMYDLTDKGRSQNALSAPYEAGQRVTFAGGNIGAVLSYEDVPEDGVGGTIILVKAGDGKKTADGNMVFVQWDDGKFRPIFAEHLRVSSGGEKRASSFVIRVADLVTLSDLFVQHKSADDELIHRATKDLWSFRQSEDGFIIERLFDYNGDPLKV